MRDARATNCILAAFILINAPGVFSMCLRDYSTKSCRGEEWGFGLYPSTGSDDEWISDPPFQTKLQRGVVMATWGDTDGDGDEDMVAFVCVSSSDQLARLAYFENRVVLSRNSMNNSERVFLPSVQKSPPHWVEKSSWSLENISIAKENSTIPHVDCGGNSRQSLSLVDYDSDGDLDLLVHAELQGLSNPNGPGVSWHTQFYENIGTVASPDWDPTGKPAWVMTLPIVFNYQGSHQRNGNHYSMITFADMNGDGNVDAVTGEADAVFIYTNLQDYNNENAVSPRLPIFTGTSAKRHVEEATIGAYAYVAVGDLDNDGDEDIMVGSGNGDKSLYVIENTGSRYSPEFTARGDLQQTGGSWLGLTSEAQYGISDAMSLSHFHQFSFSYTVRPLLHDLDADGREDFCYFSKNAKFACLRREPMLGAWKDSLMRRSSSFPLSTRESPIGVQLNVDAGRYVDVEGAIECKACAKNTYTDTIKQTTCKTCETGKFTFGNASSICADCPAGFAGTNCRSCPDGWFRGIEDSSSRCVQCMQGRHTDGKIGSSNCQTCGLGQFGMHPGFCTACSKGKYQDSRGQTKCKDCGKDRFGTKQGSVSNDECVKCNTDFAAHTTTGGVVGADSMQACICRGSLSSESEGFYKAAESLYLQELNKTLISSRKICIECPLGAQCTHDGTTISTLTAKSGFWRHDIDSPVFHDCDMESLEYSLSNVASGKERCCPKLQGRNGSICQNLTSNNFNLSKFNPDLQCGVGYRGPLCGACAEGYVLMFGDCQPCPNGSKFHIVLTVVLSVAVVFMLGMIATQFYCKNRKNAKTAESSLVRIFDILKLFISFVQILSAMPVVFDGVPWPKNFKVFSIGLAWFNLDVFSLFSSMNTCTLVLPALEKFAVHMLVPPIAITACVLSYGIPMIYVRLTYQNKEMINSVSEKWRALTSKAMILIVLLLYPGLSTRIFSIFRCVSIPEIYKENYLASDFNVKCWNADSEHMRSLTVGVLCLFVYVIGVPVGVLLLLYSNKRHLHDTTSKKHESVMYFLGGLYNQVSAKICGEIFLLIYSLFSVLYGCF